MNDERSVILDRDSLPSRDSEQWRYALVGGVGSLPFTTFSYWQTGSELSFNAVLFGGVIAGYLAARAGSTSSGIGARVGVIGGLPVLWVVFDVLAATTGLAGPAWSLTSATAFSIGLGVLVAFLGFALAALIGEAGARVGGWLASHRPSGSRGTADH